MTNNVYTTASLETAFNNLWQERESWEQGAYKTSNEQLYDLLEKCFNIYKEIRGTSALCRSLRVLLNDRKMTCQTNTSLPLKIVRLVFGDCGKRALSYARVLKVASSEKPEAMSFRSYISNAGGIEQLKRSVQGVTPAEKARSAAEFASTKLLSASSIVDSFQLNTHFSGDGSGEYDYCVALVRRDGDGLGSIVHASCNTTLVRAMLAAAAKTLKPAETAELERTAAEKMRDGQNSIIKSLAA